jgi:hypothetical protein
MLLLTDSGAKRTTMEITAMITKDEIEAKSAEFEIHAANVERDYVFGWFLAGLYTISPLKDSLILKGGNCFRKPIFSVSIPMQRTRSKRSNRL